MASNMLGREGAPLTAPASGAANDAWTFDAPWLGVVRALASLKFSVVLFVLGILLVLFGTLAQVEHDVNAVLAQYFRTTLARVDLEVFAPRTWFPQRGPIAGSFYFPGGWTIGCLMVVNLLAAHGLRFKPQASGERLWYGWLVIATGAVAAALVVMMGNNNGGSLEGEWLNEITLWYVFQAMLLALFVAALVGLFRLEPQQHIERVSLIALDLALGGVLGWLVANGKDVRFDDSTMRILWQLLKATLAASVMLAGCWMVFKKRAGVVLLHAGVGLMLINELYVGLTAHEFQMQLWADHLPVNYLFDVHELELAVIDKSDPRRDHVTVVPQALLVKDKTIEHQDLPFNVELLDFYQNCELRDPQPGEATRATRGAGLLKIAEPRRRSTGTDVGGEVDRAAAFVRFTAKDATHTDLGTCLLAQELAQRDIAEPIEVAGKTYDVYLRCRRTYTDFSLALEHGEQENYPGTNIPKSYSSNVRLVDKDRQVDRSGIRIWMNNPLRFAGVTFYQHQMAADPNTGEAFASTLQVVANPGWMIPYMACMLVVVGMLGQFGVSLLRFLNRQASASTRAAHRGTTNDAQAAAHTAAPATWRSWLPAVVVVLLAAVGIGYQAMPPRTKPEQFDLYAFGRLPVRYEGRVQPLDALARNSLQAVSGSQTFKDMKVLPADRHEPGKSLRGTMLDFVRQAVATEAIGPGNGLEADVVLATDKLVAGEHYETKSQPATVWLLDMATRPERADRYEVFKIDNPDVCNVLGLRSDRAGHRYAYDEFQPKLAEFEKKHVVAAEEARERDPHGLELFHRKVLELSARLHAYRAIRAAFSHINDLPLAMPEFRQGPPVPAALPTLEETRRDPALAAARIARLRQEFLSVFTQDARGSLTYDIPVPPGERPRQITFDEWLAALRTLPVPQIVDQPADAAIDDKAWAPLTVDKLESFKQQVVDGRPAQPAPLGSLSAVLAAYRAGEVDAFHAAVKKYADALAARPPAHYDQARVGFEAFFNHCAPFFWSIATYVLAFVLAALGWMLCSGTLNRTAVALVAFTFLVHTAALVGRIYISGRPPVTNLYGSAVFIAWAGVLFGIVFEWIYRLGIGTVLAAASGFAGLVIADRLSGEGDTFKVLQAVLDTQFWLATHVVCVTFGYATTYVAAILGMFYVLGGVLTPNLHRAAAKDLGRMIYGTTCFAIFFSFFGTVLGGLWADDSWGRFWGWDPKENGALIIVLWNAVVLHARWDGMVKERGMAVLATGGAIVTTWSWFVVNQLGVGLHSYGRTDGVLEASFSSMAVMLAIALLGLLPKQYWWSFRRHGA